MDKLPHLDLPRENDEYIIYNWNIKNGKTSKKASYNKMKVKKTKVKRKNVKRKNVKKKTMTNKKTKTNKKTRKSSFLNIF